MVTMNDLNEKWSEIAQRDPAIPLDFILGIPYLENDEQRKFCEYLIAKNQKAINRVAACMNSGIKFAIANDYHGHIGAKTAYMIGKTNSMEPTEDDFPFERKVELLANYFVAEEATEIIDQCRERLKMLSNYVRDIPDGPINTHIVNVECVVGEPDCLDPNDVVPADLLAWLKPIDKFHSEYYYDRTAKILLASLQIIAERLGTVTYTSFCDVHPEIKEIEDQWLGICTASAFAPSITDMFLLRQIIPNNMWESVVDRR